MNTTVDANPHPMCCTDFCPCYADVVSIDEQLANNAILEALESNE